MMRKDNNKATTTGVVSTRPPATTQAEEDAKVCAELRTAIEDMGGNINNAWAQEIAELRQQGIEVDDDDEPAPENKVPDEPSQHDVGEWVTPNVCPRRVDSNITNVRGRWKNNSWNKIREMEELALFRMCFPGTMG